MGISFVEHFVIIWDIMGNIIIKMVMYMKDHGWINLKKVRVISICIMENPI